MSKIKNGGLDQYGAGPFEQQQFGTAGVEKVNTRPNKTGHVICIPQHKYDVFLFLSCIPMCTIWTLNK